MAEGTRGALPVSRRERKRLDVHRRIRRAAAELFREKGYEATTVEEIAERADVAKGTFFNYFPRKDALLVELAGDLAETLLEELGPVEEWRGSAHEQLLQLFLHLGDLVARHPELSKVMIIENMRNFWLHADDGPIQHEFRHLIRSVLDYGRARGEIAPEIDLEAATRLLEAAHVTTVVEWLKAGADVEEFRRDLTAKFAIIFRGLGSQGPMARVE